VIASDVDGTLTTAELEEFGDLLTGHLPDVNEGAPEVPGAWARRGYRRFYLTARPGWPAPRTREFVRRRGLPAGVVRTTLTFGGAIGEAAAACDGAITTARGTS
jgi:hypothetical protein